MSIIKIYTEDSYGVSFFKLIVDELKNDGDINIHDGYKIKRIPGRSSAKFTRMMRFEVEEYDKIIINVDSDGELEKTYDYEKKHIPRNSEYKVFYILNHDEIEEWILYAKNINYRGKPSKIMSRVIGKNYEKNMLPKILSSVLRNSDEKNRLKTYEKFEEFINAVSS